MKKRVLLLCTHNSCRSQMAEGLVNADLGDRFQAFSAGTVSTSVNPLAIRALAEIGIDISGQKSQTLDDFAGESFDYVITLCGSANTALFRRGTAGPHGVRRSLQWIRNSRKAAA